MAEKKEQQEGKFLTLRKNFLPILVSPRVDELPRALLLTTFVTFFTLFFSGLTVFLVGYFYNEVLGETTPLPVTGKAIDDCDPVLSRSDFRKSQPLIANISGQVVEINENIESTVLLLIRRPELFNVEQFGISTESLDEVLEAVEEVSEAFDINILAIPANDDIEAALSFLVPVFEGLRDRLDAIQFIKGVEVVFIEELDDIVDLFDDIEDAEVGNLPRDVIVSLQIEFETDLGANCVIVLQPESNNAIEGFLNANCFFEVDEVKEKVFENIYTSSESRNVFAQLVSYFLNFHSVFGLDERLIDVFPDSVFVDDRENSVIIEEILVTSNAFCIDRPPFDYIDQFGLISGFYFAFEGLITFIFAITLFRGKLGFEEGEVVGAQDKTRRLQSLVPATEDLKDEDGDSILEEDEEDDTNIIFDTELKKKMYQRKGQKSISLVDLQRAVFNPRCRTIPHAVPVSSVTFAILMTLSITTAIAYQDFQTEEVCFSTAFNAATDAECPDAPTIRLFLFEDTANSDIEDAEDDIFGFGSIPIDYTVQINNFDNFKFSDLSISTELEAAILAGCPDEAVESGFCLDNVEGFELINNFTELNADVLTSSIILVQEFTYTFENAEGNPVELEVFSLTVDNPNINVPVPGERSDIEIRLKAVFEDSDMIAVSKTSSRNVLTRDLNATLQSSTYIRAFLQSTIINPEDLELEITSTQVRCCRLASLNFFEYLGITLGYIAILEGGITLIVAAALYSFSSALGFNW